MSSCVYSIQNKARINFLLKYHNYVAKSDSYGFGFVVFHPVFQIQPPSFKL